MAELRKKKENKCGDFAPCSDCQKKDYLECCDGCQKSFCLECLGGIGNHLFCEPCYRKKEGMKDTDKIIKTKKEVDLFDASGKKLKTSEKMTVYSWDKKTAKKEGIPPNKLNDNHYKVMELH